MGVITGDFTMILPIGKNTFGHGKMWQKLNFGMFVLKALFAFKCLHIRRIHIFSRLRSARAKSVH